MSYPPDPRINEARACSVEGLVDRLALPDMRRRSDELVGPCPDCGGDDRFNVRISTGQFLCHQCDLRGGDQIALVMQCERLDFPSALTWLCGEKPADPEEIARRHRLARQSKRKRDGIAGRKRQQAISAAAAIWREGQEATASPVHRYLARRGIGEALLPVLPPCLRFHPDLPYMERGGSGWVEIHRGPAMLGKMVQPDGRFGGVHRTWLDCDQPKGKIRIPRQGEFAAKRQGECFDPKKTLGSKKGGTIRLDLPEGADTMVVGEGIETTLTAMVSGVFPGAAFVCGVDLGNMAGERMPAAVAGKRPSKRLSSIPDMSDRRAFVPPAWVRRLIYIQDGDSDPDFTRAQLVAGLQRAMATRQGLQGRIWPAPRGCDLNDLVIMR